MATPTLAPVDPATTAGRLFLKSLERRAPELDRTTVLLLVDTAAAIGFAGGLAGAIAAIAEGGHGLAAWISLLVASALARGLAAMGARRLGARVSGRARTDLRQGLVRQVLGRTAGTGAGADARAAPDTDGGGRLMQLAVDEVDALDGYLARFVPARRAAVVAPLLVLGAVAWASPVTAAILATTLIPFMLLLMLAGAASASESRRQFEALSRLSGVFADRLRALPVVLAFGARPRVAQHLAEASAQVARRTLRVLRLAFLSSAVLEFFSALCVALVAVYTGFALLGLLPFPAPERLTLASAFFVLALAPEFYAPLRRLAAAYHDRQAAQTAAERLAAFDTSFVASKPSVPRQRAAAMPGCRPPGLRFEHLTVHHAGQPLPAVRDLCLDIAPGQTVALVGPSGSGKTSVLRALMGAAPRTAGRILLDGEMLAPDETLAGRAAWMSQAPLIVPGTLEDNLRLTRPEASPRALADVIRLTGLEAMRARRDGGASTRLDDRASGASGGELRRIALARALLDPASLWLLDEPTAHLDMAAETELIDLLARTRAGRTTVIATHSERLAAIADVVVRLEAPA